MDAILQYIVVDHFELLSMVAEMVLMAGICYVWDKLINVMFDHESHLDVKEGYEIEWAGLTFGWKRV
jgi:hypothetical protein